MIPIKYALLLLVLCSVVVPSNSDKNGDKKEKKNIDEWRNRIDEIITNNHNFIASRMNEKHPDNTPRRVSPDELKELQRQINNHKIPHWPPSAHIGGVYMTEPFNFGQPLVDRGEAELPHRVVVLGGEDLVNILLEKEHLTETLISQADLKQEGIERVVVVEMSTKLKGTTGHPIKKFFPNDGRKAFLNVKRARLVEATPFVLMPPVTGKLEQMKSEEVNKLKEKIIESEFEMTFPAWMMKGKFDSRADLLSFLYRRPRVALLKFLEGNEVEKPDKLY